MELIKLPAHSSNGTIPLNIPSFASSTPETEAPLNLSLKPQQSSSLSSVGRNSAQQSSLSSLSSLSASLGTPGVTERTCEYLMTQVFVVKQGRPSQFVSLRYILIYLLVYTLILQLIFSLVIFWLHFKTWQL